MYRQATVNAEAVWSRALVGARKGKARWTRLAREADRLDLLGYAGASLIAARCHQVCEELSQLEDELVHVAAAGGDPFQVLWWALMLEQAAGVN